MYPSSILDMLRRQHEDYKQFVHQNASEENSYLIDERLESHRRCFRRAPGPPLFSSIKSTPAFLRALQMADALANVIAVFPSTDSARWIVARLAGACSQLWGAAPSSR
jgi:hypothetical protein